MLMRPSIQHRTLKQYISGRGFVISFMHSEIALIHINKVIVKTHYNVWITIRPSTYIAIALPAYHNF